MADIFIDYSATFDGDGTTAAQAASNGAVGAFNLAGGNTYTANDKIWIRRHDDDTKLETVKTDLVAGLWVIGWPNTYDREYANRPASGTSNGWDGDGAGYARITVNGTARAFTSPGAGLASLYFSNIKFSTLNSSSAAYALDMDPDDYYWVFENIYFHGTLGTAYRKPGDLAGDHHAFYNVKIDASGSSSYAMNIDGERQLWVGTDLTIGSAGASAIYTVSNSKFSIFDYKFTIHTTEVGAVKLFNDSNYHLTRELKIINNSPAGTANLIQGLGSITDVDLSGGKFKVTAPASGGQLVINGTSIIDQMYDASYSNLSITNMTYTAVAATIWDQPNIIKFNNVVHTGSDIDQQGDPGSRFTSINDQQVAGDFRVIGTGTDIVSSGYSRTGGSSWSVQINQSETGPAIGTIIDKNSVIVADLVSGANTLTLYAEHALFTQELSNLNIWFEVYYYDGGMLKIASSIDPLEVTSDASVWDDVNPYTGFKMETTITLAAAERVKIFVMAHLPDDTGYVLIDPNLVIT